MPELVVRPTRTWVSFTYTLVLIVVIIIIAIANNLQVDWWRWSFLSVLLFLWPISLDIRQHVTHVTISGDKLRYETGLFSKTTRTIQLSKVQDVTVKQSLGQRLAGTGTLSIETAGETSRLTVEHIDQPQAVADAIVDAAHSVTQKKKGDRP